jgi:hypothetical protein
LNEKPAIAGFFMYIPINVVAQTVFAIDERVSITVNLDQF